MSDSTPWSAPSGGALATSFRTAFSQELLKTPKNQLVRMPEQSQRRLTMKYVVAILCFLLALGCLINRVPDPSPQNNPDAADRFVWRLIFQSEPPSAQPDDDARKIRNARIIGFLLFTLIGILMIAK